MHFVGAAIALLILSGPAAAQEQECAFGQYDGERDDKYEGVPYYWLVHVFTGVARATGVAAVSGYGISTTANTFFEIDRSDAAARASKTYRSFIEINYFGHDPQPRALKARLDVGASTHEFTIEEKPKDGSTGIIDVAPLYPALIDGIRKGELVHLTILDGDKKFIEQYFRGSSLKTRFIWMEEESDRIFALADAGNCPTKSEPPPSGGGGGAGPIL